MPRTGEGLEVAVIAGTLVFIGNDHGQRRAGRPAVQQAGEDMGRVAFQPGGGGAIPAGRAPRHLQGDLLHVQRLAGGQTIQHAADGLPVALAENGKPDAVTDHRRHGRGLLS